MPLQLHRCTVASASAFACTRVSVLRQSTPATACAPLCACAVCLLSDFIIEIPCDRNELISPSPGPFSMDGSGGGDPGSGG